MYFKTMKNNSDIRQQFPILQRTINGKPLIYFDNGATTQKPKQVIDCIVKYYSEQNANIHRGVHTLSREATILFEEARKEVATFIGADDSSIAFTQGTTDSINIVANALNHLNLPKGAEVVVTEMEHHSNILPWQLWCERSKAQLKVIPIDKDGRLVIENLETIVNEKTALVALTQVSNTLGIINPVKQIIKNIKSISPKTLVLVDGAQSTPHLQINVKDMDCDFFVFSGHKMYAPTGVGVLYIKQPLGETLPIFRTGGGVIKTVTFSQTEYLDTIQRFEPGTPNIEGVLGLAEAIRFINAVGIQNISAHEHQLLELASKRLNDLPEIEIYGNIDVKEKAGVISFNVKNAHPFDVGTLLDKYGVAVRTGHHCTQPLMHCLNIPGTIRASFAIYNTVDEVEQFIESLKKSIRLLS